MSVEGPDRCGDANHDWRYGLVLIPVKPAYFPVASKHLCEVFKHLPFRRCLLCWVAQRYCDRPVMNHEVGWLDFEVSDQIEVPR